MDNELWYDEESIQLIDNTCEDLHKRLREKALKICQDKGKTLITKDHAYEAIRAIQAEIRHGDTSL